jgi:hypothetical protein
MTPRFPKVLVTLLFAALGQSGDRLLPCACGTDHDQLVHLGIEAQRNYSPRPVPVLHIATNNENPNIGYDKLMGDSVAAYLQSLMWVATADKVYRNAPTAF